METGMENRDTLHFDEMLSRAVEDYIASRYPGSDLKTLQGRIHQEQDRALAFHLWAWREAHGWSAPATIGEPRCAGCHAPMGDEPSACEDETVCIVCATDDAAPPASPGYSETEAHREKRRSHA